MGLGYLQKFFNKNKYFLTFIISSDHDSKTNDLISVLILIPIKVEIGTESLEFGFGFLEFGFGFDSKGLVTVNKILLLQNKSK